MKTVTANQLTGRAIGSLFFTGFGALWLVLGLAARERLSASTLSGVLLIAAGLALAANYLRREAKNWPGFPDDPAQDKAFNRINAIQWTAIFVVALTLNSLRLSQFITPAVAAIVGLHLFPLARLFQYRPHYVTGSALVLCAAGVSIFVTSDKLQGITALGTGAILWLAAAYTLITSLSAARESARIGGRKAA